MLPAELIKRFGAFLLMGALLFQTFPQSLLILDYHLHTDMYTMYCINKDKPEMHCNGMCQLNKKLDDLEDHHHDSDSQKTPMIAVYMVPEIILVKDSIVGYTTETESNFHYSSLHKKEFISKILHPPKSLLA